MELIGDVGHIDPCFDPFADSVSVMQVWSMVCAEHTIGSGNVLDALVGSHR
jgi:hypothetical protein